MPNIAPGSIYHAYGMNWKYLCGVCQCHGPAMTGEMAAKATLMEHLKEKHPDFTWPTKREA